MTVGSEKRVETMESVLIDSLGEHDFLEALLKAMSTDNKERYYEYIARCYDISVDYDRAWDEYFGL